MAPKEEISHLLHGHDTARHGGIESFGSTSDEFTSTTTGTRHKTALALYGQPQSVVAKVLLIVSGGLLLGTALYALWQHHSYQQRLKPIGPYQLIQRQTGESFFDYYDFYDGPDSEGSAGYQIYVSKDRALSENLANTTVVDPVTGASSVFLQSIPGGTNGTGLRESIRLEGKHRFERGLFIADIAHMPAGCGVWPAFWLTDEGAWPDHGEIDVIEGVNKQSVAKTALHTSDRCSMYDHVPWWTKTGVWDYATGLPDTYTGQPNVKVTVPADNCWVKAPHQWANQGCVAVSVEEGTLGPPLNAGGGGIFVLEWDPANLYIRSWVFRRSEVPANLQQAIDSASSRAQTNSFPSNVVQPDPSEWPAPYAYFAIGPTTGCSADHFQNQRLIFNTAFCGVVSGNRFFEDCPALADEFNVNYNPLATCNAYVATNPAALSEAYWKINGVYVYERTMVPSPQTLTSN